MQSKNKNQQNALPEQQNVQALPTPPLAELSDQNGGVAAELGAAPCSASDFLGGGGVVILNSEGLKDAQSLLERCVAMYGVPLRLSLSVYRHKI